jgi:hypothetical protein
MLDIYARQSAGSFPIIRNAEFFRIELAPQNDGKIFVSLTATTVDEDEAQLLDQEITSQRVATIDDVVALIRTHVRVTDDRSEAKMPRFRNHYRCPECDGTWTDEWTAMCDDDCPHCGTRHISPYKSEDVEDDDE